MKTAPKSLYIALASSLLVFGISFGAFAVDAFDAMAVISSTMGANANRLCAAEASRGDLGCPTVAPYISFTTGRIGLGTTAPSSTLHVVGTADTVGGTDSSGGLTIGTSAGPRIAINPYGSGSAEIRNLTGGNIAFTDYLGQIIFSTIAGQNYVITANGMGVGLGSSLLNLIPSTTLQVSGSIRISQDASATTNTCDANRAGSIRYNGTEFQTCFGSGGWATLASAAISGTNVSGGDKIVSGTTNVTANTSGYVSFTTGGVVTSYMNTAGLLITPGISATTNRTSVTSLYASGNVGIGTTAPTVKLVVDQANSGSAPDANPAQLLLKGYAGSSKAYAGLRFGMYEHTTGWGSDILGYDDTASYGGAMVFRTGTGSATGTPTERMRITSSGNVGIGTGAPTPGMMLHISSTAAGGGIVVDVANSRNAMVAYATGGIITHNLYTSGNTGIIALHSGGAENVRINSGGNSFFTGGNVGIGSSSPGQMLTVSGSTNQDKVAIYGYGNGFGNGLVFRPVNDTTSAVLFYNAAGSVVGTITPGAASTAYNTTSDYRLKENVGSIEDALTKVGQLKPVHFDFRADPSHTVVDGFIAHEVQAVAPYAVTGEKDAVDKNGKPVYQQMDYGKLTPLLTAAIQELKLKNDTLQSEVDALKTQNAAFETRLKALEQK